MRPPEFTGGNSTTSLAVAVPVIVAASMRPPEFTGGNLHVSDEDITAENALQ